MLRRSHLMALLGLILAALVNVPAANAAERIENAGTVPFYARILEGDEWTAIIFYRPTSCVPPDFNLLQFFDFENAGNCGPITTDGFAILGNTPNPFGAPMQLKLKGLGAVPIWFVRTDELGAAAADGVLTIGELAGLPSLVVGTAASYSEVLHPVEGAKVGKLTVVASGTLTDGRAFQLQVVGVNQHYHLRVNFKG